jgi:outer membrane protein TolC
MPLGAGQRRRCGLRFRIEPDLTMTTSNAASLVLLLWASAACADGALSFVDAARLALEENSELSALREQEEALKLRAGQAMSPNNPTVSIAKNDLTSPTPFSGSGSTVLGLSMLVGFPGKALTQSSQMDHQALSVREQAYSKEVEILTALAGIYDSLAANHQVLDLLDEEVKKTKEIVALTERKYGMAQTSQNDVLNARLVAATMEHDRLNAEGEKDLLFTRFRALIRRPGDTHFSPLIAEELPTPSLALGAEDLTKLMLRNRPQIRSLDFTIKSLESARSNASLAFFPDMQFSGGIITYHVPSAQAITGVSRDYYAGLSFSVPLFFPVNELKGRQAAGRDLANAEATASAARISAQSDLQSAVLRFNNLKRQIASYEEIMMPAARANYTLALKVYSMGKLDYLKLNDARESWIQTQKNYIQHKLDLENTYREIVQTVGCDFTIKEGPHACTAS